MTIGEPMKKLETMAREWLDNINASAGANIWTDNAAVLESVTALLTRVRNEALEEAAQTVERSVGFVTVEGKESMPIRPQELGIDGCEN